MPAGQAWAPAWAPAFLSFLALGQGRARWCLPSPSLPCGGGCTLRALQLGCATRLGAQSLLILGNLLKTIIKVCSRSSIYNKNIINHTQNYPRLL